MEQMKSIYSKFLATLTESVNVLVGVEAAKSNTPKGKWQVEAGEGRELARRLEGVFAVSSAEGTESVEDAVQRLVMAAEEGTVNC